MSWRRQGTACGSGAGRGTLGARMSEPALESPPQQEVAPVAAVSVASCPSCGEPSRGRFCSQCGQSHADVRVPVGKWLRDYIEDTFHLDSRLSRSLWHLVTRPGALTQAYVEGRRSAYVRPFRLYLMASFLYLLALTFFPPRDMVQFQAAGQTQELKLSVGQAQAGVSVSEQADTSASPPRERSVLLQKLLKFTARGPGAAQDKAIHLIITTLPKAMFVLVPVFALLLTLLYRGSGRFYAEHFLFALHFHAFSFLTLALALLVLRGSVRPLGPIVIMSYLFLALRRVYGQPRVRTLLKAGVLWGSYGFLLLMAIAGGLLATVYFTE